VNETATGGTNLSISRVIEIKSASRPIPPDVTTLKLLLDENPAADLRVFCTTPVPYEMDGIKFLPFVEGVKGLLTS